MELRSRKGIHDASQSRFGELPRKADPRKGSKSVSPSGEEKEDVCGERRSTSAGDEVDFRNAYGINDEVTTSSSSSSSSSMNSKEFNFKYQDIQYDKIKSNTPKKTEKIVSKASALDKLTKLIKLAETKICLTLGITLILIIIIYCSRSDSHDSNELKMDISTEIKKISAKFPKHNKEMWVYFTVGIERITDASNSVPGEPAVFFMAQWSDAGGKAFKIAKDIGNIAAQHIEKSKNISKATVLNSNDLNSLEKGFLLDKYRSDLENSHVLIIPEIEKVSPMVVQDLRYLCDEENPAIQNLAIFLILNTSRCQGVEKSIISTAEKREQISLIEKCLINLWSGPKGLDSDAIQPLLARILSVVLPLYE